MGYAYVEGSDGLFHSSLKISIWLPWNFRLFFMG